MSPNFLLCLNEGRHKSLGGFFCHLMEEYTNINKGKSKNACQVIMLLSWWQYKLKEYAKHTKHQYEEHMEYGDMHMSLDYKIFIL